MMNENQWRRSIPGNLAIALLVATAAVLAQGDRISIRLMPQPNQVVRYHTVQEMRFTLPFPGATADPTPSSPASPAIAGTTDSVHTMAVGAPDAQGHAEARFTYDQLTMQMSLNGQPMPLPLPLDSILRQPFTATIDRDGRIIDVKGTDENAAILATIKPMLASALSGPSSVTLAPGETTAVPLSGELALPIPGANTTPMALTGEMKYTLISVEAVGTGHVAHLTSSMTGHIVAQDIPMPGGTMSMTMSTTGDGTLDVKVEQGIVTLRRQRQTIDIQIQNGATAAFPIPPMKMRGVMTFTITGE